MSKNTKHVHQFGNNASAPEAVTQYVHGIAKNGAVTHWPINIVEVREDKRVYNKTTDEFLGIEDTSVVTNDYIEKHTMQSKETQTVSTETETLAATAIEEKTSVKDAFKNTHGEALENAPVIEIDEKIVRKPVNPGTGRINPKLEKLIMDTDKKTGTVLYVFQIVMWFAALALAMAVMAYGASYVIGLIAGLELASWATIACQVGVVAVGVGISHLFASAMSKWMVRIASGRIIGTDALSTAAA